MSHLTTVATEIRDLTAATAALREMGFEVLSGGQVRGGGATSDVEALIKVPRGGYDLGLRRAAAGTYEVVGDWFYAGRHVGGQQAFMGRLNQLYGVHRATQEAQLNGYMVERETDANGLIRLTLTLP